MTRILTATRLPTAATLCGLTLMLIASAGCHERRAEWVLENVSVNLPEYDPDPRLTRRAGMPPEWLEVHAGGNQTVLVACHWKDDLDVPDDHWARTWVVVIDGPPVPGIYTVTPENGRFIQHTPWQPAREPYDGLEGEIEIKPVDSKGRLPVECALRNVLQFPGDPVYPLRGTRHFEMGDGDRFCTVRLKE